MKHHGEGMGDELPSAFSGRRGLQEGSQATRLQAETLSTHSPKWDGHRAGAFLPATSHCIPLPTNISAALLPLGTAARVPTLGTAASRVPATPLHQTHSSHPQAQEIHMSGALQQHKGGSLLAVGIRS